MKTKLLLLVLVFVTKTHATDIFGVYPTHWWTGMKNPKLQVMIHGEKVGLFTKFTLTNPGVKIEKVHKVENNNYVFLDLNITPSVKPGTFKINMSGPNGVEDVFYELKERNKQNGKNKTTRTVTRRVVRTFKLI